VLARVDQEKNTGAQMRRRQQHYARGQKAITIKAFSQRVLAIRSRNPFLRSQGNGDRP
jgi:hypothetical protein